MNGTGTRMEVKISSDETFLRNDKYVPRGGEKVALKVPNRRGCSGMALRQAPSTSPLTTKVANGLQCLLQIIGCHLRGFGNHRGCRKVLTGCLLSHCEKLSTFLDPPASHSDILRASLIYLIPKGHCDCKCGSSLILLFAICARST